MVNASDGGRLLEMQNAKYVRREAKGKATERHIAGINQKVRKKY